MAQLSEFERLILPFCADAPIPTVHDAVLDASIEFCTRTRAAREKTDPITLVPATIEYEIDAPDRDSQVVEVVGAWLYGRKLNPIITKEILGIDQFGTAKANQIEGYFCRTPGMISLYPSVSDKEKRALVLEIAYAPTRNALSVPDILLSRYAEQIRNGALSRLHQHAAAYADPQRAIMYGQLFESACARLADETQHGFAHKPLRVLQDDL